MFKIVSSLFVVLDIDNSTGLRTVDHLLISLAKYVKNINLRTLNEKEKLIFDL